MNLNDGQLPPELEAKVVVKDPLKEIELRDEEMEFDEEENEEDFELYRNLA